MNKRYYFQGLCLLTVLLFSTLVSCTFDYFEDETNYIVYVPGADKNLRTETYGIEDLSILIYNNESLKKEKHSGQPFSESVRSKIGNFTFRLFPDSYSVYCFTGMHHLTIEDRHVYSRTHLALQKHADGTYQEPGNIHIERLTTNIPFPGPLVVDTVRLEQQYNGRICVVFKNLSKQNSLLTIAHIKDIEIEASGIGTIQYLNALSDKERTRSARNNPDDKMRLTSSVFDPKYKDFEFGIQNNYFPSPDLSGENDSKEPIILRLIFRDTEGKAISLLEAPVIDENGDPIVLHTGETLIVEIDGSTIRVLHLDSPEPWDPQIAPQDGGLSPFDGSIVM